MTSAFLALALTLFALAVGLARGLPTVGHARTGPALLGLAGVGLSLVATFQRKPVHTIGLAVALLVTAALLPSWRFGKAARWQSFHRLALALAMLNLVLLAIRRCSITLQAGARSGQTQILDFLGEHR